MSFFRYGQHLFADGAPRYVLAMSMNVGFGLACILLALTMCLVLLRANKRFDSGEDVRGVIQGQAHEEIQGISKEQRDAR